MKSAWDSHKTYCMRMFVAVDVSGLAECKVNVFANDTVGLVCKKIGLTRILGETEVHDMNKENVLDRFAQLKPELNTVVTELISAEGDCLTDTSYMHSAYNIEAEPNMSYVSTRIWLAKEFDGEDKFRLQSFVDDSVGDLCKRIGLSYGLGSDKVDELRTGNLDEAIAAIEGREHSTLYFDVELVTQCGDVIDRDLLADVVLGANEFDEPLLFMLKLPALCSSSSEDEHA